ncbi:MAG: ABC-type transport auxiliary lipoprotein family protein [Verrucomicrobiota bacterium]
MNVARLPSRLCPAPAAALLACLSALLWSGCSFLPEPKSDPTRYYVLGESAPAEAPAKVAGGLVVGLRAVQVPAYLGGKAMIVRAHGNEIDYRDFSRWAEPLEAAIATRVADRLNRSAGVARVLIYPFPLEVARDVDVKLRVLRCEGVRGDAADTAEVVVEVQVFSAGGGDLLATKVLAAPVAGWDGTDFGRLAELLGEGVATIADELVTLLPAR